MNAGRFVSVSVRITRVAISALLIAFGGLALFEAFRAPRVRTVERAAVARKEPPAVPPSPVAPRVVAARPPDDAPAPARRPPRDPDALPDTPAGRGLRTYLEAAGAGGNDADRQSQRALEQLRGVGHAAGQLIAETYRALPEQRYTARWMMIDTLAALGDHASLEQLQEIAEAAIPEERFSLGGNDDGHGEPSSVGEETMIRAAAIRGISNLAELGNRDAEQALREIAANGSEGVREKAALAYVELGVDRRARKAEMMDILAPSDHWMARVPVIPAEHLPPLAPPSTPPARAALAKADDMATTPLAHQEGP